MKYFYISIICVILFASCTDDEYRQADRIYKNMVLMYMAADNSLSPYAQLDINELLKGNKDIPDSCAIIIFLDDNTSYPCIYEITNKTQATNYNQLTPSRTWNYQLNSASADNLDAFMRYAERTYKGEINGLVMWSHATGWRDKKRTKNAFARDDRSGNDEMNISDMVVALSHHSPTRFIFFDACFMQCIESTYDLRNVTQYVIGSPAEIPADGAPYAKIVSGLFSEPFAPALIINPYGESYENDPKYGALLAAVDTRQIENFAEVTAKVLSGKDLTKVSDMNPSGVMNYLDYGIGRHYMPDFYDVQGMMMSNLTPEKYAEWKGALDKLIPVNYATPKWYSDNTKTSRVVNKEQFSGLTMFIPLDRYKVNDEQFYYDYFNTEWYNKIKDKK